MIKERKSQWFEAKVRYEVYIEHLDKAKKVSHVFVIDAMTFAEAEARVTEHVMSKFTGKDIFYVQDTFEIVSINKASYEHLLSSDTEEDSRLSIAEIIYSPKTCFFKCKISFLYLNESTGEEKKHTVIYLVKTSCLDAALKIITEYFAGDMRNYERSAVTETNIIESIVTE